MCEVDQYRLRLLKTNSPLNLLEGREKISTCNSQSLPLFPHLKARLGLVALSQSLAPTTAPSQPRGPWVIIFLAFQVFLNRNTATQMPRAKAICIPLFQGKTQGRFWKQGGGTTRCVGETLSLPLRDLLRHQHLGKAAWMPAAASPAGQHL